MPAVSGSILVTVAVATALVFLIFLALKVDNLWDINYGHVTWPLLLFFGLAAAIFGYRGLTGYARDGRLNLVLYRLGFATLALGSAITIYLLTKKVEFELALSFTAAMLPFMIALLLTGGLFIASLNVSS